MTIPQVEASRPERFTQSAAELGQKASGLASQIDRQRATLDGLRSHWEGTASDAAIAKAQPTLLRMQQIHDALTKVQTVLQEGGSTLSQTKTTVLQTVSQLKGQGWQVGADGTVSVRPGSPLDQYAKVSPLNAMKLQQLAATNSVNVKALLASFDTTDRALSQNLRAAVGGLDGTPAQFGIGDLPEAPPYDTGAEIPVGKTPEEVNKWWQSLPPDKRAQLLKDWPDKLGNLNGVPVADRSTANKTILQQDLDRPAQVAAARGVTVDEVLAHPDKYGMAGPMMTRYNNALKVQEALNNDARDATDANGETPDILLMKYEPEAFGGDGAAAIAIGNPDKAANTTVMVSGLTTSVAAGTLSDGSGVNVYNEANRADWNNSTAVVQWMGYDAPDDQAVAEPNMARNGAQILAPDVNALAVTHEGSPAHTTVIGHSYGSTTVADAAAGYGMHADDVVLVGCPGTDLATSAADFHLPPDGHLFVGSASTDIVTNLGSEHLNVPGVGLGTDPSMDGFGSTRFHAEVATFSPNPIHEHTSYFTPGSESLFSIADIVSGHGDALEHDGMTADHRVAPGLPFHVPGLPQLPVIDPELLHTSNNDHHHTGSGG
ncbi:MAG: alpha/beta hydrolase [Mycobacterium sp.]